MRLLQFFRLDDDHPFTGRHMLAVTLAFFGVIIAVNIAMTIAATGTFPGLVVANSYVASQNYNELLERGRAQAAAGWKLDLGEASGVLEARLSGADAAGLTVSAVAGRPSTTTADRIVGFTGAAGAYRAVETLGAGLWDVDIEARRDGALIFRELRRIYVRGPAP